MVTPEQLLEALWPDTFVQPEVLRKYILEIRRVLGDPPKSPRFVETLPKRGYRFIAPVQEEEDPHALSVPSAHVPANLVGREAALEELYARMSTAVRGHRQLVFVTGEAGIGKTSLVDTFHAQAARAGGVNIARGQCVEGFGGKESYYPVLEAFGLFMRGPGGAALMRVLADHAPTWLMQFPYLVGQEQRELLRREILGANRERMLREICEALEFFTADQPLVLILEDLQLADESTLDLLSALARRRVPARLMLLATYRPADVIMSGSHLKGLKQDLIVHRLCTELTLAPITRQDVAQYLSVEFPASQFDPALCGLIHHSSDGNPLFMVALLERFQRQGWIAREGEQWMLTVPPEQIDPGVPETLQQMLQVQLDLLSASEQQLLRAASVSGWRFSAWAVAAMTDTAEAAIEQVCEDLAARQQCIRHAGILELPNGSVSAQYEFKHSLYREVLYARLPPTYRRQFHLRLAEKAESLGAVRDLAFGSEIAAHFEAARDFVRATRCLVANARLSAIGYRHGDSIEMLRHAMDLLAHLPADDRPPLEIQILEHLSDVLYAQGEMAQSAEMDYKVVELAGQRGFKGAQVNAWTRLARVLAFQDPERCIEVCQKAVDVATAHNDPLLQARAEMLLACWRIITNGPNSQDAEACNAALAKVRGKSDELPAYYEILYAHVQCVQGDYEGACQTAYAGIPRSLESNNLVVFLSAHSSLAHALLHLGRWGELLEIVSAALGTAEKNGNAPWTGIFQATLGWLRIQAQDYVGALHLADDLLLKNTEEPAGQVRTMATVIKGFALLSRGVPEQAAECFASVCNREVHPRFFLDWYWRIVGRLALSEAWLAMGEVTAAAQESDRALQAALSTTDPVLRARAWVVKVRVAQSQQDWHRAEQCLKEAFDALTAGVVPSAAWQVHAAAAELYSLRGNQALVAQHRNCAAATLHGLACSFREGEPLRETLLAAAQAQD